MLAYVNLVQNKEKEIGCDVLTHQKWFVFMFSIILLILTSAQERSKLH
jgi:isocitrate lyase